MPRKVRALMEPAVGPRGVSNDERVEPTAAALRFRQVGEAWGRPPCFRSGGVSDGGCGRLPGCAERQSRGGVTNSRLEVIDLEVWVLDWGEVGAIHSRCLRKVEMSVLEWARQGLRDIPSNAEWAISQVRGSVAAAGPFGGDAVQLQMNRAEEAAERAREADEEAVQAAQEAKELSDHALEVTQRGRARVKQANRDTQRELAHRIKRAERDAEELVRQAERDAEELVKQERVAAAEEAEQELQEVYEEVEAETEPAQHAAEEAKERAEQLAQEARQARLEAKELAEEAAE